MIVNELHSNMLVSPVRTISGKVELYNGSTYVTSFSGRDNLSSFTVERGGDKKFFGYGVAQELELHLIDKDRTCVICKDDILKSYLGVDDVENNGISYISNTPKFYVTEVTRDENTNALTVKAADKLYKTRILAIGDVAPKLLPPYTIRAYVSKLAEELGLTLSVVNVDDSSFDTLLESGLNLDNDELSRAVLDDIAEATQTIYYVDHNDNLVFKRLDKSGDAVTNIDRGNYYTLKVKDPLTLTSITHATELGDNYTATTGEEGITQYIRENSVWNIHPDTNTLLENAIAAVGGLTISPFDCDWRGNYLLEIGDKITFTAKDDTVVTTYLLNDKYTYSGGLRGTSSWEMPPPQEEVASNPTNISDKLRQTFAKVDKIEQKITLYVGEIVDEYINSSMSGIQEDFSQLQLTTDSIAASVVSLREASTTNMDGVNKELSSLTKRVDAVITSEDVNIAIKTELSNGVDKVVTSKGFTFDDEGLHVNKSDSDLESILDEDGLTVTRSDATVLTAKSDGVNALNITVRQYLNIGGITFEPLSSGRVGCFLRGE